MPRPSPVPTSLHLRPTWIVVELQERGSSLADVARELGVTPPAVSQSLTGPSSARIDAAVAEKLGLPPSALYPERYDAAGRRIDRRSKHRREISTRALSDVVQTEGAA